MNSSADISLVDRIELFARAGIKVLRGTLKRFFLQKCHGLLFVGKHVTLSHPSHIVCGKNCKFEDYSEIHGLSSHGLQFGDSVTIGRGVMIRPSSYYGIDLGYGLTMGNNSSIGPYGYVGCSGSISIGNNVMIGPKCSLFAENHVFADASSSIKSQGVRQKGIVIKDNCWIGSNVVVLDGVTIGEGSVVGAGTVVLKDVPPYSVLTNKKTAVIRSRKN